MQPKLLGGVAIAAVVLAWALPMQSVGCGQNAHYAATRSFVEGHPYIDRYAQETCDLVRHGAHVYAAKGPALDFWSAPWYLGLRAAGLVPRNRNAGMPYPAAMTGVPLRAIWQIGLWAVVLPGALLLLLVRRLGDEVEPGTGTAVAVILGLGTLVLPFSTLLFAHVPAALLGFAAFTLLYERRSPVLAGVCAGLAVAVDLPLLVVAAGLLLYAWRRAPKFALGGVLGAAPLWAFGIWAFGNPFKLAYSGAAIDPGAGGVEQTHAHRLFFTLTPPHPHIAVQMLLTQRGLLALSPVLAASAAGIVLLWRRALRAEAALIAGLAVAELAWLVFRPNYELALGGWSPGPRYLVPLLPFLAFALAPALRRAPLTVGALAAISIGAMTIATSAEPLLSNDDTHHWIARIADGNFAATWLSLTGIGHGWLAIIPFYALILVAVAAAAASTRVTVTGRDAIGAVAAVLAWIVIEHGAPELLHVDDLVRQSWGAVAALLLLAAAFWAVVRLRPEGLLLLPFALLAFDRHTKWAVLLAAAVLVALVTRSALPRRVRSEAA